jgi:hypothetical protein
MCRKVYDVYENEEPWLSPIARRTCVCGRLNRFIHAVHNYWLHTAPSALFEMELLLIRRGAETSLRYPWVPTGVHPPVNRTRVTHPLSLCRSTFGQRTAESHGYW